MAVRKKDDHDPKLSGKEWVYFRLQLEVKGRGGWNLVIGADAEAMEECYPALPCSVCFFFSFFFLIYFFIVCHYPTCMSVQHVCAEPSEARSQITMFVSFHVSARN